jgi:deoxyribose-phosphate aldolase
MELNKYIDHTLLKAAATEQDIIKLCSEAKEHSFYSVCVNSCYVPLCRKELKGSDVKIACVAGFPLGAMDTASKAFEAGTAAKNGADEIDMVINIGQLKAGNTVYVYNDIQAVVEAAKEYGATVKVIIECCELTDDEKRLACHISEKAGAAFVKTSTGFSTGGATKEDVALMRAAVSDKVKVKAAGGIRTREKAEEMIAAGADRIGASAGIEICKED